MDSIILYFCQSAYQQALLMMQYLFSVSKHVSGSVMSSPSENITNGCVDRECQHNEVSSLQHAITRLTLSDHKPLRRLFETLQKLNTAIKPSDTYWSDVVREWMKWQYFMWCADISMSYLLMCISCNGDNGRMLRLILWFAIMVDKPCCESKCKSAPWGVYLKYI